jgi:hypothetical protein
MFRTVRRTLHSIRYHSASPQRTGWHRVADAALFVTLILGILVAFVLDTAWRRPVVTAEENGRLYRNEESRIVGVLIEPGRAPPWTAAPVGEFTIEAVERVGGWPFVSSRQIEPVQVTLAVFGTEQPFTGSLAELGESEFRMARAIRQQLHIAAIEFHRERESVMRRNWLRWLVNAAMWWVMLYFAFLITLLPARVGWALLQRARLRREYELRRRGVCPGCGYDLRGLEFHDRCPECGRLND